MDKNAALNAPKYAISSEKSIFVRTGYTLPTPNQAFWIRICPPEFQPDLRHFIEGRPMTTNAGYYSTK